MAKKPTPPAKLTKKELLQKMETKLQDLTLLMSALKGDRSTSQANLEGYLKKFEDLTGKVKT